MAAITDRIFNLTRYETNMKPIMKQLAFVNITTTNDNTDRYSKSGMPPNASSGKEIKSLSLKLLQGKHNCLIIGIGYNYYIMCLQVINYCSFPWNCRVFSETLILEWKIIVIRPFSSKKPSYSYYLQYYC